jgi:hypothetical protein
MLHDTIDVANVEAGVNQLFDYKQGQYVREPIETHRVALRDSTSVTRLDEVSIRPPTKTRLRDSNEASDAFFGERDDFFLRHASPL